MIKTTNKELLFSSFVSIFSSFLWLCTHIFHVGMNLPTFVVLFYYIFYFPFFLSLWGIFLSYKHKKDENKTFVFHLCTNLSYPILILLYLGIPYIL